MKKQEPGECYHSELETSRSEEQAKRISLIDKNARELYDSKDTIESIKDHDRLTRTDSLKSTEALVQSD